MKRKSIIIGVLLLIMTAGLYVGDILNERNRTKCDCVFPNSRRYGVIDKNGVCRVSRSCVVAQARK
ncbi:MAG TPA: hypothetical protein VF766_14755 [Pyrinomonadaceae bacterium]